MIIESLKTRRSNYDIDKNLTVDEKQVFDAINEITELVPDAFNMKSSRVAVVTGDMQNRLWDTIYDAFDGKVAREKIDSFKNGYGTILYFYDSKVVKGLEEQFPLYAANFKPWAEQASAMLQISIWTALSELGMGANLQHYNPVIDKAVKELLNIPEHYVLNAQMPFGGLNSKREPKEKEDISLRVKFFK